MGINTTGGGLAFQISKICENNKYFRMPNLSVVYNMVTLVWRWYKINLYELSSFKDIYTLLPTRFDVKVKYCSIF